MAHRRSHGWRVLVAAGTLLLAGCGDDTGPAASTTTSASPATTTTTVATTTTTTLGVGSTPELALAAYQYRDGSATYAGDCAGTTLEHDAGKWCSTLEDDRGSTRVYGIGPTFSEYTTWLLLEQVPAGWAVVAEAPTGEVGAQQPPPW